MNSRHPLTWVRVVLILCALAVAFELLPVTAHPYDASALTGEAQQWYDWGIPLLYGWKFGLDYTILNIISFGARLVLIKLGISGAAALHVAFKLPLVAASLFTGVVLRALAKEAGFKSSHWWAWFVSPVTIWIAAGHGQIEPLAIFLLFYSLLLLERKNFIGMGFITALGVGLEYFPLVALGGLAIKILAREVRWKEGLLAGLGFVAGIILCFGPTLATPAYRWSLERGLLFSAGASTPAAASRWSLWSLVPGGVLQSHWFALLALLGSALVLLFGLYRPRHYLIAIGITLVSAVVLDPNALPQFALIVQGGLALLLLRRPYSNPLWFLAAPLIMLSSYLLSQSFYVYFIDVRPQLFAKLATEHLLPVVVISNSMAANLSKVGLVSTIISVVYLLGATKRSRPNRSSPSLSTTMAYIVCTVGLSIFAVYAGQPQLWPNVVGSYPRQLFDYPLFTARKSGQLFRVGTNKYLVAFDPVYYNAPVKPTVSLIGSTRTRTRVRNHDPELYVKHKRMGRSDLSFPLTVKVNGHPLVAHFSQQDQRTTISGIPVSLLHHNRALVTIPKYRLSTHGSIDRAVLQFPLGGARFGRPFKPLLMVFGTAYLIGLSALLVMLIRAHMYLVKRRRMPNERRGYEVSSR